MDEQKIAYLSPVLILKKRQANEIYKYFFKSLKKSMTSKISVVLPNYNCGQFIEKSIESILNQSFRNFELIVIDDASTDISVSVISKYLQDDRVKLIKLKNNIGNYKARNIGITQSEGKYIAVMDADDIADKDRLLIQYNFIRKTNFACIGSQGYLIDKDDRVIGTLDKPTDPDTLKVGLLKNNFILHPSLFYNMELLQKHNLEKYDENYAIASDYDFVARCSTRLSITNIPDRLIYYRLHATQISAIKNDAQVITSRAVRLSLLNNLKISPSKKEMYIYNHLMEGSFFCNEELKACLTFCNKILYKNRTVKLYDEKILFDFFQAILSTAQAKTINNLGYWENDVFDFIASKLIAGNTILEFGSGCGTNRLLKNYDVVSIEHDFRFFLKRKKNHKIYYAPIENNWYNKTVVRRVLSKKNFDLIIIDGPLNDLHQGILQNIELFHRHTNPVLFVDINREPNMATMLKFCKFHNYRYQIIERENKSFAYCEKNRI